MADAPVSGAPTAPLPHAYFLSLRLANIRCFGPEQFLDLSDGNGQPSMWNILLGENGVGKTTVLQCLPSMCMDDSLEFNYLVQSFVHAAAISSGLKTKAGILPLLRSTFFSVSNGNVGDVVSVLSPRGVGTTLQLRRKHPVFWFGYSAARRIGKKTAGGGEKSVLDSSLYDEDAVLLDAEDWLAQADYAARLDDARSGKYKEIVEAALLKLLPDVGAFRYGVAASGSTPTPIVEAQTPYGWVRVKDLSLGYRAAMGWIVDFAAQMIDRYPDSADPLAEPAVCLVDEIDLHLHPKWQRTLIQTLSETFKKTQFIVTAHSPLIAQAAPNANVALLRRDGDHVVIENGWEKARNWRVDQILASDLFDADIRSAEVQNLLSRRRDLVQKGKRSAKEEAELSDLNTRIDALPSASAVEDDEARDLLRRAAALLPKG